MNSFNWKKPGWIAAGIVLLGLVVAWVMVGVVAFSGNNAKSPAASTGPAVSSVYDGSTAGPLAPDRVTLMGKIDTLDGTGFQLLAGPRYEKNDRVTINVDQGTKILDAKGQSLKLTDLKQGQEITVETDPIENWNTRVKVKAYQLNVLG